MAIAQLTKKIARDSGFQRDGKPVIVVLEPNPNGADVTVKLHGSPKKHSISAGALYDQLTAVAEAAPAPVAADPGQLLIDRVLELLPTTPVGDDQKANYDVKVALEQILKRIKAEQSGHNDVVDAAPAPAAEAPAAEATAAE